MPLTDTAIKAFKPKAKQYKQADEKGLFLIVRPNGGKWWRLKYRFDGKEKLLALGTYPDVGLKDARLRRDEARELLAAGIDPGQARKEAKEERVAADAATFEAVAREWFERHHDGWAASHADKIIARLENDPVPLAGTSSCQALGLRVKQLRAQLGLTQEELADRCDMFRTYMSRIESGAANPTLTMLYTLAAALEVSVQDLFEVAEEAPLRVRSKHHTSRGRADR